MKKTIKLTESDLMRLVKRIIKEGSMNEGWADAPGMPGNINYLKDAERNAIDRAIENEERKYHIPSYNPKTGGGWKPEAMKEYILNKFGLEIPDDEIMVNRYGFVGNNLQNWVKNNI